MSFRLGAILFFLLLWGNAAMPFPAPDCSPTRTPGLPPKLMLCLGRAPGVRERRSAPAYDRVSRRYRQHDPAMQAYAGTMVPQPLSGIFEYIAALSPRTTTDHELGFVVPTNNTSQRLTNTCNSEFLLDQGSSEWSVATRPSIGKVFPPALNLEKRAFRSTHLFQLHVPASGNAGQRRQLPAPLIVVPGNAEKEYRKSGFNSASPIRCAYAYSQRLSRVALSRSGSTSNIYFKDFFRTIALTVRSASTAVGTGQWRLQLRAMPPKAASCPSFREGQRDSERAASGVGG